MFDEEKVIKHHGVKGMKWGVRRFQPYSIGYQPKDKKGVFKGKSRRKENRAIKKRNKAELKEAKKLNRTRETLFDEIRTGEQGLKRTAQADKKAFSKIEKLEKQGVKLNDRQRKEIFIDELTNVYNDVLSKDPRAHTKSKQSGVRVVKQYFMNEPVLQVATMVGQEDKVRK